MVKPKSLGEFEITILAAVLHLGDEAYGARIIAEIEMRTERATSLGAVHATLSRLESKGLLQSRFGESTAKRGGRAKKYVRLTEAGYLNFTHATEALHNMLADLPPSSKVVLA